MSGFDRKTIMFWSKIIILAVGVALAITFQFTGKDIVLLLGLAFLAAAFVLIAISEIAELVALRACVVEGDTPEAKEKSRKELHNKKVLTAVKMAFAVGFAVLALVIMFLY